MQYFKSPNNTDENIIHSIEILRSNVDFISEYRVIGGEPLINKNWANIVNSISNLDPESNILIYTNGTICPKDNQLEPFQHKKVTFYITDYGDLSRNIGRLEESLIKSI